MAVTSDIFGVGEHRRVALNDVRVYRQEDPRFAADEKPAEWIRISVLDLPGFRDLGTHVAAYRFLCGSFPALHSTAISSALIISSEGDPTTK